MLRPLSVTAHAEGFLVGDLAGGDFVTMPEVGVVIIDALRDGASVGEAAERARERTGEDIDVCEFAETLIELGFVAEVDGRTIADQRDHRSDGGHVGEVLARLARPLFSPAAWVVYGTLFLAVVVTLVVSPSLRPRGRDLLFLTHDPIDSAAIVFVVGMALGAAHECAHWLAARVEGVPASIGVSRRWYFLVLQTDMTGIWALPRRRRLGPLLAGMAFDTVRLAALLAARIAADAGNWHPSALLEHVIMALIATTLSGLVFQFFIFLRTDLYAVLVTWLGCLNLTRVTQLLLQQRLPWMRGRGGDELAEASRQDLVVARWYRWVYLSGIVAAAWFFVAFFGPNIVTIARATVANVEHASPARFEFWRWLVLGLLALAPVPLTVLVFVRERTRSARTRRTGRSVSSRPADDGADALPRHHDSELAR